MKNLFDISSIDKGFINLTYYILLVLGISFSLILIMTGISDPFGEFLIIFGVISLILIPLFLKIIFSLIIARVNHDKSKRKDLN
jgi:cell division protein FtsW (lipid II flippase)